MSVGGWCQAVKTASVKSKLEKHNNIQIISNT